MNVQFYIPPAGHPLAPLLHSIWRVHANGAYSIETILPKGNVDILFNLSQPLRITLIDNARDPWYMEGVYLAGMQTRAITSFPQGEVLLLGVSMKVEASALLLPLPLEEVTDTTIEGGLVFKGVTHLRERLGETADFAVQVQILTDWLVRRIRANTRNDVIRHACLTLSDLPAGYGLNDLARSFGFSPRHLRRLFLQHVGVTPGQYLRLSRFIRALYLMPTPQSLTEIAHVANYFDQAHFCRDFREIAGLTPGEYREKATIVPGHLFVA